MKLSGTRCALALAIAGMLTFGPAMADKPSHAGGGKGKQERSDKGGHSDKDSHSDQRGHSDKGGHPDQRGKPQVSDDRSPRAGDRRDHFEARHRTFVHDYYSGQHRAGRCPPGLAKKHNGCMPPGQAKKWDLGQPLARNVTFYPVPQPLLIQFGQPPAGYRYVRVSSDILLMQISTRNIVDSIPNLGRS